MSGLGSINLTNQFLIAMPGMADDHFAGSVVYLCEHTERGALGLVINKPIDITIANLFERVEMALHGDWTAVDAAGRFARSRDGGLNWFPTGVGTDGAIGVTDMADVPGAANAGQLFLAASVGSGFEQGIVS